MASFPRLHEVFRQCALADLCEETLSRMTCTGVSGAIPSATWSRKARNSSERCRSTVRPTTFPVNLMPGLHGKRPLRPPQRLDLRLLVHREDDGVVGRVDIQAHHVAPCRERSICFWNLGPARDWQMLGHASLRLSAAFTLRTRTSTCSCPSLRAGSM